MLLFSLISCYNNGSVNFLFIASPAGSKLGLRMTTLHEEPLNQRPLQEEPEDTYSDPEYGDYESYNHEKSTVPNKMRLSSSKTMDSLLEISRTSNVTNFVTTSSSAMTATKIGAAGIITPSMSSSSSSGYGSQAVSCTNLTNDDTFSLKSMCIDDTPDFDRSTSTSPPNKRTDTIYTPGSGQKRFNPFDKKEKENTIQNSPAKKILTPTKEHPLQDLPKKSKSEFSDDEDYVEENEIITVTDINENNAINDNLSESNNVDKIIKQTNEVDDNQNTKILVGDMLDDMRNNSDKIGDTQTLLETSDDNKLDSHNTDAIESEVSKITDKESSKTEAPLPDWVTIGESVLIRPYNTSGVISFIGPTHFQVCI